LPGPLSRIRLPFFRKWNNTLTSTKEHIVQIIRKYY
jgi:hypothetical protein